MKYILISSLSLALCLSAGTASANQELNTALSIIDTAPAEISEINYRKLKDNISAQKAGMIEADFIKAFGPAKKSRRGMKIWEVPMPERTSNQAEHLTIMFGTEGSNDYYISVDARGPGVGNNPRLWQSPPELQGPKVKKPKKPKKPKLGKRAESDF